MPKRSRTTTCSRCGDVADLLPLYSHPPTQTEILWYTRDHTRYYVAFGPGSAKILRLKPGHEGNLYSSLFPVPPDFLSGPLCPCCKLDEESGDLALAAPERVASFLAI